MDNQNFDYTSAAATFSEDRPVWKRIINSICTEFRPSKTSWFGAAFSVVLSLTLGYILATSEDTVPLSQNICGIILDVQIAIFGCIFAVYSILLAFLSDSYVKRLLRIDYHGRTNYLQVSTGYYESALLIYFVAILLSFTYKLLLECMPEYYTLTRYNIINEFLAFILLVFYFLYSIRTIYELKSIITNTLLLFRTSIQFKILSFEESNTAENISDNEDGL